PPAALCRHDHQGRGRWRYQARRLPDRAEVHLAVCRPESRGGLLTRVTERYTNTMGEILVLVEHDAGTLKKVTLELLTAARAFGAPAAVFVGPGFDTAASRLAEYGAAKVYVAETPEITDYVVAPTAELLASLVGTAAPEAVLVASTAEGKEVAARLALKIDSGVLTDAVILGEGFVAEQSIFGGSSIVHSRVTKGVPIITMRPNATSPKAADAPAAAERIDVSVELSDAARQARVV